MRKLIIYFFILLLQPIFPGEIPSLYFTPNRETDKIILSIIQGAESSLYIAGYSVRWERIKEVLRKKKGKIDIKVITEEEITGLPEEIVKIYKKPGLFHPKFITVDGKIVIIGSGNFTDNSFHLHHNHFLLIKDRNISEFFNRRFLAWWEDNTFDEVYENSIYRVYFSPETNCESIIIQEISKARNSIYFAHYRFTSEEIAKAIVLRKLAGVDVSGIMDASGIEPYSVFYPLSDYGCKMKKSNLAGFLHDKLFIIDSETVITGSYNPTSGARRNTECLIIIKDEEVAKRLLAEWKKLYLYYALP